jgi:phosphatidylglycerophosphate synthase
MIDQAVLLFDGPISEAWSPIAKHPKKILGLTIAERLILAAHRAGIGRFWILSQEGNKPFPAWAKNHIFNKKGILIETLSPNDLAHYAAVHNGPKDHFFLIDGTVLLETAIFKRMIMSGPTAGESLVLREVSGRNEAGVILCSPEILSMWAGLKAEDAASRPWSTFTDPIIRSAKIRFVDPGGAVVLRVRSKRDVKTAERRLLQTARKPNDGSFTRIMNRPISLILSRLLLKLKVRPLQVSLVNLIIGLASGWFIGRGTASSFILGAILFQTASILDGCDGETARLTFRESRLGANMDMLGDITVMVAFFMSLPIGMYNYTLNPLYLGLGAAMILLTANYYFQISWFLRKSGTGSNIIRIVKDIQSYARAPGRISIRDWLAARIAFAFRRDFMAFAVLALIPIGGVRIIMGMAVAECLLGSFYLTIFTRNKLKALAKEGRPE